jgi:hypothetical protein
MHRFARGNGPRRPGARDFQPRNVASTLGRFVALEGRRRVKQDVAAALEYLKSGRHLGKVIIKI